MNKGYLYAVAAYVVWGFLPVYWKALQSVPALEVLSHRIVWSLVFITLLLTLRHNWHWLLGAIHSPRVLFIYFISAIFLSINWGTYIWAVDANRVVETSLGYFINPLISVLLGVIFLRERLRQGQWTAVAVAAGGVIYLTAVYQSLPWIALVLAFSFGLYGLIRKTAPLDALEGLTLETAWVFVPSLLFIIYQAARGTGAYGQGSPATTLLLMGAGVATAVPLLWFGMAARRIPLSSIGILQYIAPTCQLLIGVFLYDEPFNRAMLLGFCLIWLALIIFSTESIVHNRKQVKLLHSEVTGDKLA